MVQLNLCYEALTQKRKEYDAAKGVTGQKTFTSGGSTSSREAWWRSQGGFDDYQDDYYPFHFDDFTERVRPRRKQNHEAFSKRRPSWEEFAEAWDEEFQAEDLRGQRNPRGRAYQKAAKYTMWESSSDEEEVWIQPRGRRRKKRQRFNKKDQAQEPPNPGPGNKSEEVPEEMWVEIAGRNMQWAAIGGSYSKLEKPFNGRAAFEKKGQPNLFMFWSQQYGDWKIAERLQDDGACLAFAEDMKGRMRPWISHPILRWRLWEPSSRRFVPRRLNIEASSDGPSGGNTNMQDDDEVPWSRPHWSEWSTTDLIRWCERRRIDLSGCFDREAVLDRVIQSAKEDMADAEDDTRREDSQFHVVRIASRVKTDGSYTRPPTLDRRNSLFGNRVERFQGVESDILPWLYRAGDKSRLYGIFFGNEFAYSLVWTRYKFWGRPGARPNRYEESW